MKKHIRVHGRFGILFLSASEICLLLNKMYMLTCILMIYCCIICREFSRGGLISCVNCNFHAFLVGYTAFLGEKKRAMPSILGWLDVRRVVFGSDLSDGGGESRCQPRDTVLREGWGTLAAPHPLRSCCRARYGSRVRAGREDGSCGLCWGFGHPWRPSASSQPLCSPARGKTRVAGGADRKTRS